MDIIANATDHLSRVQSCKKWICVHFSGRPLTSGLVVVKVKGRQTYDGQGRKRRRYTRRSRLRQWSIRGVRVQIRSGEKARLADTREAMAQRLRFCIWWDWELIRIREAPTSWGHQCWQRTKSVPDQQRNYRSRTRWRLPVCLSSYPT